MLKRGLLRLWTFSALISLILGMIFEMHGFCSLISASACDPAIYIHNLILADLPFNTLPLLKYNFLDGLSIAIYESVVFGLLLIGAIWTIEGFKK